jgi:hypothetical protein
MSYTNGDVLDGPWSLLLSRPVSTPTYRRPSAPNAMPLKPWNFYGAV